MWKQPRATTVASKQDLWSVADLEPGGSLVTRQNMDEQNNNKKKDMTGSHL